MVLHIVGDFCPDLAEARWYKYPYAIWDAVVFVHVKGYLGGPCVHCDVHHIVVLAQ